MADTKPQTERTACVCNGVIINDDKATPVEKPTLTQKFDTFSDEDIMSMDFALKSQSMYVVHNSKADSDFTWASAWADGPHVYVQGMVDLINLVHFVINSKNNYGECILLEGRKNPD